MAGLIAKLTGKTSRRRSIPPTLGDLVGKEYKPWLIGSVIVLVCSLVLLAGDVVAAFLNFSEEMTPLWVVVVGAVALLGVAVGFGGLFLLMATAGWKAFREGRRIQVLPPGVESKQ